MKSPQISNTVTKAKIILYADSVYGMDHWGIGFGHGPFEEQGCRIQNCILTNNRTLLPSLSNYDAIMFPLIKMMNTEVRYEGLYHFRTLWVEYRSLLLKSYSYL